MIVLLSFLFWTEHPPSPQDTPFPSHTFITAGVGLPAAVRLTVVFCHPPSYNGHPSRAQFCPAACGVLEVSRGLLGGCWGCCKFRD